MSRGNFKHGLRSTSTYNRWNAMKQRCLNPNNASYHRYGGRGISVCERWLKFENFFQDMGIAPDGMMIERIDNSKGYSPENCRWATFVDQCRNRRSNRLITAFGKTMMLSEWAEHFRIPMKNLWYRLNSGWDVEDALKHGKMKNQYG